MAIALRILAGNRGYSSYFIAFPTAYNDLHETIRALDIVRHFSKLSRSQRDLEKVARRFKLSRSQSSPFDACVGALDGIFKMRKPRKESNPASIFVVKAFMRFQFNLYATLTMYSYMHLVGAGLNL